MKVFLESFGCTLNHGEARAMAEKLQQEGHDIIGDPDSADAVVVATCVVIVKTEKRMWKRIEEHWSQGRSIVVAGCMTPVLGEEVSKRYPGIELLGPFEWEEVSRRLEVFRSMDGANEKKEVEGSRSSILHTPQEANYAIVPICQGCLGTCTYCITRFARGSLTSILPDLIEEKVARYIEEGFREIRLTSQDTGVYGSDIGLDLPALLENLAGSNRILGNDHRFRIGMANPWKVSYFQDKLRKVFEKEQFFRFLHLPLQSGDDQVLGSMGRMYSKEDFMVLIQKLRDGVPDITLSTDIIVGFPGETEEQFEASVAAIERCEPNILNITRFSPRPGTIAATMPDKVVGWKAKERSRTLTKVAQRISLNKNEGSIGKVLDVLLTEREKPGTTMGRTQNYIPVIVPQELRLGEWKKVEITGATESYLRGLIIE